MKATWFMAAIGVVGVGLAGFAQQAKGDADAEAFRAAYLSGKAKWSDVLARAKKEGGVNWYHWGGSTELNTWIDQVVKPELAKFGVALKTSRINDTRNAVDLVIADNASGRGLGQGSVDAIWINGENFYTLATQNLVFGSFADKLPNSKYFYFDPKDARSKLNLFDFGFPNQAQEVPWSGDQYTCYIDTARLKAADAPNDYGELEAWLTKNPGHFTYIKPPHYNGNTFVQQVMYAFNPDKTGADPFQKRAKDLGLPAFAKAVKPGFEFLKRIEPMLLGGGVSSRGNPIYPNDQNAAQTLFVNGQVDMSCEFGKYNAAIQIKQGKFAKTVQNVIFPKGGMISNKNFIVIPSNAPNPASALVLANVLSSVKNQVSKLSQIGYVMGVDSGRLSQSEKASAAKAAPAIPGTTLDQLNENAVPDTNASQVDLIEKVWIEYIERQSSKSLDQIISDVWADRVK